MKTNAPDWLFIPALLFWGFVLIRILRGLMRGGVKAYRDRLTRKAHLEAQRIHTEAVSRELPTKGIPDFYLDKPRFAIFCYGRAAIEAYLRVTESQYRNNSGYPPDWEWRRYVVLRRDSKTCTRCNTVSGELHVHHCLPISEGGLHGLENLITLCRACHSLEHPSNKLLRRGRFNGPYFRRATRKTSQAAKSPSDRWPGSNSR